ncbi:hypothetical protein MWMV7_MWMV7_00926 [Acinetobacter calcoaceticus]|uniref:Uncharacterized protein n=1 Tax=Acinetobacter calcoaceticus TaxID=471 RepID=A0A446ZIJ6_ACICA|nr:MULTISPECIES: hypothetical protein [Acinetobacter]CAI3115877.1 hypothetical protein MWMV7_MWMV7_00926 [Acinetobacter calcoaceticus]VAX44231.1 Uncharacterised protein [Acinetobacter calcoaceticus]
MLPVLIILMQLKHQVDAVNVAGGRPIKLMSPISISEQKGTATIGYIGSTPAD